VGLLPEGADVTKAEVDGVRGSKNTAALQAWLSAPEEDDEDDEEEEEEG